MTQLNKRRARAGYTFDACPGCGKSDDIYPRLKSGVCNECRSILDGHARFMGELSSSGDKEYYGIPEVSHWLPYLQDYSNTRDDSVQKAFWNLALAASDANPGGLPDRKESLFERLESDGGSNRWHGYKETDYRLFNRRVAENLRDLFNKVRLGIDAAYAKGKSDGTNILSMLSRGELSTPEFERRAGIVNNNG